MLSVITGWDTLVSALIGFAVLLITTLGPKVIALAADWLQSKGRHLDLTPPPAPASAPGG